MSGTATPPAVDAALVRKLIAAQFPHWAGLPVAPVAHGGHDNRTFHLGDAMSVRLPSSEGYAPQAEKEQTWLPVLAPQLPLPVPRPLAAGRPAAGYPFRWSVNEWLPGEQARTERIRDQRQFAADLAGFLTALQRIDPAGGPPAGAHSSFRGAALATYDGETRRAVEALAGRIPPRPPSPSGRRRCARPGRDPLCGSTATSRTGTCWSGTAVSPP